MKLSILQDDLDATARVWDSHIIRPSKNEKVPHGRPNVMYCVPELYGSEDLLCAVTEEDMDEYKQSCTFRSSVACDEDVFELCIILMKEHNMKPPKDAYQALDLYLNLRMLLSNLF